MSSACCTRCVTHGWQTITCTKPAKGSRIHVHGHLRGPEAPNSSRATHTTLPILRTFCANRSGRLGGVAGLHFSLRKLASKTPLRIISTTFRPLFHLQLDTRCAKFLKVPSVGSRSDLNHCHWQGSRASTRFADSRTCSQKLESEGKKRRQRQAQGAQRMRAEDALAFSLPCQSNCASFGSGAREPRCRSQPSACWAATWTEITKSTDVCRSADGKRAKRRAGWQHWQPAASHIFSDDSRHDASLVAVTCTSAKAESLRC